MRFIGLDVHLDFCEIAICEAGKVRSAGRVPSSPGVPVRLVGLRTAATASTSACLPCIAHRRGNLRRNDLDGVSRRLKASKIRQDAAVLGDFLERDPV